MNNEFDLQENVILAPLTTLRIGGPARYFVRAESEETIVRALQFADEREVPAIILGGGSNVLVSDKGFDGLVLQVAIKGIGSEFRALSTESGKLKLETGNSELVTVGAGEDWDEFVAYCVANKLAGVECLSGIPGFVGGTPVQNVGAYGQEVSETIVSVRCIDTKRQKVVALSNVECGFRYRTSIFNSTDRGRYIVLGVTFELIEGGEPKVIYKELVEHFERRSPSLTDVREAVLKIRRAKSMVIVPDDPNSKSAGSFFKNPVITWERFREIEASFERVPHFDFNGMVKVPAAWLIEKAGFNKGFAHGNAGVSTNHTLALVNLGGATAAEMIELKNLIQAAVHEKFAISLEPEPVFVGF